MIPATLKLGSLGDANTFGAQAAQEILDRYPIFGEIVYYDTVEEIVRFEAGKCDALCAPQQMSRTGAHSRIQTRMAALDSKLHVLAEVSHAFHCSLLVKPGAEQAKIRRVLGHNGSVTQSRDWLAANLPAAEIVIVDTSSFGAASEVASGDGTIASIGTPEMAKKVGLQELHKDIDFGSIGSYWALSPYPVFSERPDRLVIAGRFNGDDHLSTIIGALGKAGYSLQTLFSMPSGKLLNEYDYALRFTGSGSLSGVRDAVALVPEARLAGAFEIA
jgi:prephenate dehydratase